MSERGVPLLALALASAASSSLHLPDDAHARLRAAFTDAVAKLDAADRAYRGTIEQTLPRDRAHAMLSAMAAFRDIAHQVRESATREIREMYQRYKRSWDWIDPLDTSAALPHGLSHADATRIATIADRARAQVDAARAQANERVMPALSPEEIGTLREARLERREAFARDLRAAMERGLSPADGVSPADLGKATDRLTQLAEGWY